DRRSCFFCCRFATLAPRDAPSNQLVDLAELANGWVERKAGNTENFVGAPEQLCSDSFAVDLDVEFSVDSIAAGITPLANAGAARSDFGVGMLSGAEKVLRPDVDRVRLRVTAVIQIRRRKLVVLGEYVAEPVSMSGLHSS